MRVFSERRQNYLLLSNSILSYYTLLCTFFLVYISLLVGPMRKSIELPGSNVSECLEAPGAGNVRLQIHELRVAISTYNSG